MAAATAGVTTTPARGHVNVVVHAMFLYNGIMWGQYSK